MSNNKVFEKMAVDLAAKGDTTVIVTVGPDEQLTVKQVKLEDKYKSLEELEKDA